MLNNLGPNLNWTKTKPIQQGNSQCILGTVKDTRKMDEVYYLYYILISHNDIYLFVNQYILDLIKSRIPTKKQMLFLLLSTASPQNNKHNTRSTYTQKGKNIGHTASIFASHA